MDRQTAEPEGLPPLHLSALRDLDLDRPPVEGMAAHVSSASGVARRGDFVYVIGDDLLELAVFRLSKEAPGTLRRVLSGETPTDPHERKRRKADLEALTMLPPFDGAAYGALFGLGSGSGDARGRGFVWPLGPDGSLTGDPWEIDLAPVYDRLRETAPDLNIEGAAAVGERLWLFQRGNTAQGLNMVAELDLDEVMRSLQSDRRIDCAELAQIRAYDLGELDGVPLTFSDATPLADELIVFTASAEASDDAYGDGEIRGSVVGTIDRRGKVERLRTIDRRWKVEGVYASIDARVIDFLFVCDQDDPDTPSPLLSAAMPVESRFERGD
jgi:hypothetical protein